MSMAKAALHGAALLAACAAQAPVCAAPAPAAPAHLPAAGQTDPRVTERATELARLLNSEEIIIGDAASDAKAVELMNQLVAGNADMVDLEKQYPGIAREMAQAMLPIVNRSARERLPQLWERQAALYAKHFNDDELVTLIAFYSSPTGTKLIRVMMASIKPDNMMAEAAASKDLKISSTSVMKDIRATAPQLVDAMDAEDQRALAGLMRSGLVPRLKQLGPQTQELALAWYDESAPWEEAEIDKAMLAVVEARTRTKR